MKPELFVFAPDLLSCDGDLKEFLLRCKIWGATGLRVFFQFSWYDNVLSPYKQIGTWKAGYPDAPDMPFYDQMQWNPAWENKVHQVLSAVKALWPECKLVATLHDYCSFKQEGWLKYLYPFLSSSPDRDINLNEPSGGFLRGGFWGLSDNEQETVQFLHRRYARKVVSVLKEYDIDFYIEFCNEDAVQGWDDAYANKYYRWVYKMLREEGMPAGRFIVSGRYAAIVEDSLYSQHGIISALQIEPENLPPIKPDATILSGDGGSGGSGEASQDGKRGIGIEDAKPLADVIVECGFYGYEYMDRGMWRDKNNRANLNYFNDACLLALSMGLKIYEPPKVNIIVCKESGLLPTECCPEKIEEVFELGDEPYEICYIHQKIPTRLCGKSGKLPNDWCSQFEMVDICSNLVKRLKFCDVCRPPCSYWRRRRNFKRWLKCLIKRLI